MASHLKLFLTYRKRAYSVLNVDDVLTEQPSNPEITEDDNYIEYHFTAAKTGPIYLYDYGNMDPNQGTQQATLQYVGYYHQGDEVSGKAGKI